MDYGSRIAGATNDPGRKETSLVAAIGSITVTQTVGSTCTHQLRAPASGTHTLRPTRPADTEETDAATVGGIPQTPLGSPPATPGEPSGLGGVHSFAIPKLVSTHHDQHKYAMHHQGSAEPPQTPLEEPPLDGPGVHLFTGIGTSGTQQEHQEQLHLHQIAQDTAATEEHAHAGETHHETHQYYHEYDRDSASAAAH